MAITLKSRRRTVVELSPGSDIEQLPDRHWRGWPIASLKEGYVALVPQLWWSLPLRQRNLEDTGHRCLWLDIDIAVQLKWDVGLQVRHERGREARLMGDRCDRALSGSRRSERNAPTAQWMFYGCERDPLVHTLRVLRGHERDTDRALSLRRWEGHADACTRSLANARETRPTAHQCI